ncbi:MAG: phenylalanine-4-hydroxylase, partial [Arenicella sp.]
MNDMNKLLTQEMSKYTSTDFEVWEILFNRQMENLETKGSVHYLNALKEMSDVLKPSEVPDFKKLNDFFQESTGWEIAVVPGLIPVEDFFDLLADKKF